MAADFLAIVLALHSSSPSEIIHIIIKHHPFLGPFIKSVLTTQISPSSIFKCDSPDLLLAAPFSTLFPSLIRAKTSLFSLFSKGEYQKHLIVINQCALGRLQHLFNNSPSLIIQITAFYIYFTCFTPSLTRQSFGL